MEKKLTIVEKIMALLQIGEAGKIQHFFDKQVKTLNREINGLNKNKETLEYNCEQIIDNLKEQLEDAEVELESSYLNVSIADVDTNAKQDEFSDVYWSRVEKAESKVKNIRAEILLNEEKLKEELKSIDAQISERKRRISKIS